ncbi:DNA-directed RNA polymerase subunit alpha, partial [Patescibacteria group bacterium]|nr:DNA-directed RNA polymerase subunit alpha [Patescibacteria group bacterium]
QHFNLIAEPFKPKTEEKPVKKGKKIESDLTKIEIEDLKISSRTINILLKNNIKTVGGILRKSKGTLLELEGMGEKGIKEIEKSFKKIGLEIK